MTRAELGLTAFIFALIYGAGLLPGFGRFLGRLFSRGSPAGAGSPPTDLPDSHDPS
ncbi:MAG TPA: hypothetical protein PLR99_03615 [Polyangiaceae bacterium]|nr:hypothetical protein [Polyangiaceae bacterium]